MKAKNTTLSISITIWAILIGAVVYSHVAFFPAFLHHLPDSTSLISGSYAINDEPFWKTIHPILIVSLILSLIVNWKLKSRTKLILIPFCIYIIILVITFSYFVPELLAFAKSDLSDIPAAEWIKRGKLWEQLSWVRGSFLMIGFGLLLQALIRRD